LRDSRNCSRWNGGNLTPSLSLLFHSTSSSGTIRYSEEQHDDQVLHELLRAFKALTLTAVRLIRLFSYLARAHPRHLYSVENELSPRTRLLLSYRSPLSSSPKSDLEIYLVVKFSSISSPRSLTSVRSMPTPFQNQRGLHLKSRSKHPFPLLPLLLSLHLPSPRAQSLVPRYDAINARSSRVIRIRIRLREKKF